MTKLSLAKSLKLQTTSNSDVSGASIGIFDSGFGGLTVMRAIMQRLPQENIIYFGDTARLPYGNKNPETILRYALENTQFLLHRGVKAIVVACNTACSAALKELHNNCPIPVIGVTLSAIDEIMQQQKNAAIAIIGTRSTIQSHVYQKQVQTALPQAQIHAISCPLFVPLVEEGYIEHPLTIAAIQEYLTPLKHHNIDCLILGCTHYPLIAHMIQKELGTTVRLIDPAQGCAEQMHRLLSHYQSHNSQKSHPHYEFHVSDDPEKFRLLGRTFLNYPIEHVHLVQI